MTMIISIEPRKRMRGTYLLDLDDGRQFTLHEEVIIKYRLEIGMGVDPEQLSGWIYEADIKLAYDRALKYLSYRSRSRKEIADYLAKREFSDQAIGAVLDKLQDYKFIDDEVFAQRWVKNRIGGKPVGKRWIANELKNKGIDQQLIDKALDEVGEESEYERAYILGEKYYNKYRKLAKREMCGKVGQALMRRGFDWDTCKRVTSKLGSLMDDEKMDLF